MGKQWKQWLTLFWGAPDGDCSHEIKRRLLLGRKVMTNLDSILKSRDITLSTKVRLVKAMIFVFWMLSFKPTFSLSSFTFTKRLFSYSSLSAIRKGWCHLRCQSHQQRGLIHEAAKWEDWRTNLRSASQESWGWGTDGTVNRALWALWLKRCLPILVYRRD